jgi:hypothetical protein
VAKFVSIIWKNYKDILGESQENSTVTNANTNAKDGESAKRKDIEDECSYASAVLGIDIGEIDERLRVKLDMDKMGFVEKSDEAKIMEEIKTDLQEMFFPNRIAPEAKHFKNNQQVCPGVIPIKFPPNLRYFSIFSIVMVK